MTLGMKWKVLVRVCMIGKKLVCKTGCRHFEGNQCLRLSRWSWHQVSALTRGHDVSRNLHTRIRINQDGQEYNVRLLKKILDLFENRLSLCPTDVRKRCLCGM